METEMSEINVRYFEEDVDAAIEFYTKYSQIILIDPSGNLIEIFESAHQ